jgi:hypothetical protein
MMDTLGTYFFPLAITAVFAYYNGWQWRDELDGLTDPVQAKKRWKAASVVLRGLVLASWVWYYFHPVDWRHMAIAAVISLPAFDILINVTAGRRWLYLGNTSKTDRLGAAKWFLYIAASLVSIFYPWILNWFR